MVTHENNDEIIDAKDRKVATHVQNTPVKFLDSARSHHACIPHAPSYIQLYS